MSRKMRLRRRFGHSAMASVEGAASDLVKTAKGNPIVTAAVVGATGGLVAGAAGVLPGAVIGAAAGVAVERIVKG